MSHPGIPPLHLTTAHDGKELQIILLFISNYASLVAHCPAFGACIAAFCGPTDPQPGRDHEQGGGAGLRKVDFFRFGLFLNSSAADIVFVTLPKHGS